MSWQKGRRRRVYVRPRPGASRPPPPASAAPGACPASRRRGHWAPRRKRRPPRRAAQACLCAAGAGSQPPPTAGERGARGLPRAPPARPLGASPAQARRHRGAERPCPARWRATSALHPQDRSRRPCPARWRAISPWRRGQGRGIWRGVSTEWADASPSPTAPLLAMPQRHSSAWRPSQRAAQACLCAAEAGSQPPPTVGERGARGLPCGPLARPLGASPAQARRHRGPRALPCALARRWPS